MRKINWGVVPADDRLVHPNAIKCCSTGHSQWPAQLRNGPLPCNSLRELFQLWVKVLEAIYESMTCVLCIVYRVLLCIVKEKVSWVIKDKEKGTQSRDRSLERLDRHLYHGGNVLSHREWGTLLLSLPESNATKLSDCASSDMELRITRILQHTASSQLVIKTKAISVAES